MPARPIRNDAVASSNSPLPCITVSVTQPYSASRPPPPVTDCRLRIMVRSRERTRTRRAHRFGCQKHGISGSRWTSAISVPRLHVDCGQYWSTRLGNTWAIGTDRGLGELPVKPATPTNLRAPFSTKMLAHTNNFEESRVSQQPLAKLLMIRGSQRIMKMCRRGINHLRLFSRELGPRGLYFNHLGFFHRYRKSRLQLVTLSCYSSSDPY